MSDIFETQGGFEMPKSVLLPFNQYPDPELAKRVIAEANIVTNRLEIEDAIIYYNAIHRMLEKTKPFSF